MKFATKLMVVPFVKTIENPQDSKVNELDDEMTNILSSKMSLDEKIKTYNQTLYKFETHYNPDSSMGISHCVSVAGEYGQDFSLEPCTQNKYGSKSQKSKVSKFFLRTLYFRILERSKILKYNVR
jgi:hypothetical protein